MTFPSTSPFKTLPVAETVARYGPETLSDAQIVEALLSQEPRAIATFMEYLITSHGPSSQFSHLLGVARLKADDVPHAIEALRAACNLDQENETYWYALGKALERQGSKDARSAYEKALRLKPSYTKARRGLERLPS